jgi:hypothetical protein
MEVAKDLAAGAVGGSCGVLIGQPFDTIKVRMSIYMKEGKKERR